MKNRFFILVTGAAGNLGSLLSNKLFENGYSFRATDCRFGEKRPYKIELGDLRDEYFIYRIMDGINFIVHLANHSSAIKSILPQRLLVENLQMDANVFYAASQMGIKNIIFSSSVQVFLPTEPKQNTPPFQIPYLPLDGAVPPNPGTNAYGLSKEIGERILQIICQANTDLSAVSLRFPMLVNSDYFCRALKFKSITRSLLNASECFSHLSFTDAINLIMLLIERPLGPGYHQYFPATSYEFFNQTVKNVVDKYFRCSVYKQKLDTIENLIDTSALTSDLGWRPSAHAKALVSEFEN